MKREASHPIYGMQREPAPFLLVGEAPNSNIEDGRLVLCPDNSGINHSANRLLRYSLCETSTFHRTYDRCNLIKERPPRSGRGRSFPMKEAIEATSELLFSAHLLGYRGMILLGKRVAGAFDWKSPGLADLHRTKLPYLQWMLANCRDPEAIGPRSLTWMPTAIVPHPSGINKWWNNPVNRQQSDEFFENVLKSTAR